MTIMPEDRAALAARHHKLFDLLRQGNIQAVRLAPVPAASPRRPDQMSEEEMLLRFRAEAAATLRR
jgi:hypothetical protein